jgi:hypothetical protein
MIRHRDTSGPVRQFPTATEQLLEQAATIVAQHCRQYGEPVEVFEAIAAHWSSVFETPAA